MIQLKFLKDRDDCLAGKESGTRVEERGLLGNNIQEQDDRIFDKGN